MAVIKLNGENMYKKKNKQRKPTNQDFINVINSLIRDIEVLQQNDQHIMQAIELYIEFKKDTGNFDAFCKELTERMGKENELQESRQDNTVTDKAHSQN